ncbi:hypothetical protein K6U06_14170 [Acidiferrimicrobium sp. IK]|nr:hypothetical protein [Acidiferrimicrobium sp. IK]
MPPALPSRAGPATDPTRETAHWAVRVVAVVAVVTLALSLIIGRFTPLASDVGTASGRPMAAAPAASSHAPGASSARPDSAGPGAHANRTPSAASSAITYGQLRLHAAPGGGAELIAAQRPAVECPTCDGRAPLSSALLRCTAAIVRWSSRAPPHCRLR